MGSVRETGEQPSSSLNSLLRSSEGRFLLTVLEEEAGERRFSGGPGGAGLPLDDDGGGFALSHGALGVIVIDIVGRRGEEMKRGGYRVSKLRGGLRNVCGHSALYIFPYSAPVENGPKYIALSHFVIRRSMAEACDRLIEVVIIVPTAGTGVWRLLWDPAL